MSVKDRDDRCDLGCWFNLCKFLSQWVTGRVAELCRVWSCKSVTSCVTPVRSLRIFARCNPSAHSMPLKNLLSHPCHMQNMTVA